MNSFALIRNFTIVQKFALRLRLQMPSLLVHRIFTRYIVSVTLFCPSQFVILWRIYFLRPHNLPNTWQKLKLRLLVVILWPRKCLHGLPSFICLRPLIACITGKYKLSSQYSLSVRLYSVHVVKKVKNSVVLYSEIRELSNFL